MGARSMFFLPHKLSYITEQILAEGHPLYIIVL